MINIVVSCVLLNYLVVVNSSLFSECYVMFCLAFHMSSLLLYLPFQTALLCVARAEGISKTISPPPRNRGNVCIRWPHLWGYARYVVFEVRVFHFSSTFGLWHESVHLLDKEIQWLNMSCQVPQVRKCVWFFMFLTINVVTSGW